MGAIRQELRSHSPIMWTGFTRGEPFGSAFLGGHHPDFCQVFQDEATQKADPDFCRPKKVKKSGL